MSFYHPPLSTRSIIEDYISWIIRSHSCLHPADFPEYKQEGVQPKNARVQLGLFELQVEINYFLSRRRLMVGLHYGTGSRPYRLRVERKDFSSRRMS